MASTVSGTVHVVEETKTNGQTGFQKRLVVLEQEDGRFSNYIPVEFLRDNCDAADAMKVGDEVEVTYRLSGRKWQRDEESEVKYFLSAEALSFRVLSGGDASAQPKVEDSFDENSDEEVPF
jgi:hypothetical protein